MNHFFTLRNVVVVVLLTGLALVPVYAALTGNFFVMTLFTRIVILALAATSLNLILGYGGMVSFGHAVYLGIGGYAVGILAYEGVVSGFLQWPVAVLASALFALIIGALSLRTRGVYFIMITLAFSQMALSSRGIGEKPMPPLLSGAGGPALTISTTASALGPR